MTRLRLCVLALGIGLLGACANDAEYAAKRCTAQGHVQGSEAFDTCVRAVYAELQFNRRWRVDTSNY